MNKITRVIDFQKMYKLKTPASRYSELSVSISEKGMLTISSSLFNKMEKFYILSIVLRQVFYSFLCQFL